jgi:hypothetical protein
LSLSVFDNDIEREDDGMKTFEEELEEGCEHLYVYAGVVFDYVGQIPGSGAQHRAYYNWFFCNKCLENTYNRLNSDDDSYSKVQFNATPKETE